MRKKRVQYLINKRMQLAFTARFLLVTALFALFVGFLAYVTMWPVVSAFVPKGLIELVKHQILVRTVLFSIPAVGVIIAFGIVVSHRIAGPLYRIERTIDEVVRGEDVALIRLRKKDEQELKNLAERINKLIGVIKELRGASPPASQ
jgi:sensor histidine kinase YesM